MNFKKTLALIIALLMLSTCLSGCSVVGRLFEKKEDVTVNSVPAETEPVETEPPIYDTVEYTTEKVDYSIYDQTSGKSKVDLYYNKIVLTGDTPEIIAINEHITKDCDKYVESLDIAQYQEYAKYAGGYTFMNYYDSQVTNNADGIFSIRMSQSWYMGGVFNGNHYGLTYNLHTGKLVDIADITSLSNSELQSAIQTAVKDHLNEMYSNGGYGDYYETLDRYSLEDYLFYVENGELVVTFPTYTLGPGAAGAVTVNTGIMTSLQEN